MAKDLLEYSECRTFGHAWYSYESERDKIGYQVKLRCERCTTVRYDTINLRGGLQTRQYVYPDGYKQSEKMSRDEWRVQFLRKLFKK